MIGTYLFYFLSTFPGAILWRQLKWAGTSRKVVINLEIGFIGVSLGISSVSSEWPLLMYFQKQLLLYFPPYFVAKTKSRKQKTLKQFQTIYYSRAQLPSFLLPALYNGRQMIFPALCHITFFHSLFCKLFPLLCQITFILTHLQFVNVNVSSLACDFPQRQFRLRTASKAWMSFCTYLDISL